MKLLAWKKLTWNSLICLTTIAVGLSIAPKAFAALHVGDTGREVRRLQRTLGIPEDGVYGPQTESAVIRYQQKCGLEVDGVAGTATFDSINAGNCIANGGFTPLFPGDGFVPLQPGNSTGPYMVVVPGGSSDRLAAVQQVIPGAIQANTHDLRGSFINAGRYGSQSEARSVFPSAEKHRLACTSQFSPLRIERLKHQPPWGLGIPFGKQATAVSQSTPQQSIAPNFFLRFCSGFRSMQDNGKVFHLHRSSPCVLTTAVSSAPNTSDKPSPCLVGSIAVEIMGA